MRTIAKNIAGYSLWSMKLLAIVILFAASSYAQTFESRTVNLVSGTPPDLEAYQANIKGYEWTLRNGASAINLAGKTPFMLWYREPFSASVVTAQVSVVSATGGVFRATFQPSDLNPSWFTNATSGSTNLRYAVGVEYSGGDEAISHGRFRLIADPGAAGAVGVTFFSTNLNWATINWTGLPDWLTDADADGSVYARRDGAWYQINVPDTGDVARALAWSQAGSNLAATANGAAQVASNLAFSASQASTDATARAWAMAASNLAAQGSSAVSLAAISNLVVGTSNELSGRIVATSNRAEAAYVRAFASATGTPVYTESDPLFVAASNALLTKVQAASLYATGTPLYTISGIGTDAYARTTAEWASNRANAAHSIASAAATGTPIYSVSGLATGTPLYAFTESDPLWSAASNAYYTAAQANTRFATGTPLYVESNPSLAALSNGVADASATGTAAHVLATLVSNRVAAVEGAGYITSASGWSGYAATQTINAAGQQYSSVSGGGTATMSNNATAASQIGYLLGSIDIGSQAYGAYQRGYFPVIGNARIEALAVGSSQIGTFNGPATIGTGAIAAVQMLYVQSSGSAKIGAGAHGAMQFGYIAGAGASATNNANGAVQILGNLSATNHALTTSEAIGSLLIGPGTASNRTALVVGKTVSHGESSISAVGDLWSGSTNVTELAVGAARQADFIVVSNAVVGAGTAATNQALAIGAGATALVAQASAAGTNFTLAVGTSNSTLALAAYALASNSFTYASNVLADANAIGPTWSQIATANVNMAASYGVSNALFMGLVPSFASGPRNSLYLNSTTGLVLNTAGGLVTVLRTDNLTAQGVQTVAAYNNALTTTLWRWSGFVQGGTGQRGNMYESNGFLYVWSDSSNAYGRVQLSF